MRIDKIEFHLVRNKFKSPWKTAYGEDHENCVVLTRMVSGDHEGWCESSPLPGPNYSYEYGEGVYEVATRFLAPCVVGKDMASWQDVNAAMSHVKGNPFAKAAVEMAWWTLKADMEQVPLHRLLGQSNDDTIVSIGAACGICDSYDTLIGKIGKAIDQGAPRVKLKVCHGWDVDMLAAVRSVFPNEKIHIDCNSSFTFAEADTFRKMDKFHLEMIEQPFAPGDLLSHWKLQKMLDTPICLDEGITDPLSTEQALELGACRYVNIKPARVGGLGNAVTINRMCKEAGVGCWVGGMLEGDVGKGICLELAGIDNMVYPHDISIETSGYVEPIAADPLSFQAPYQLALRRVPGSPVKPDLNKMRAKTERSTVLEAE